MKTIKEMEKEFNLSEKILTDLDENAFEYLEVSWVKEFIKRLKDEIVLNDIYTADEIFKIINKLAGEKLK